MSGETTITAQHAGRSATAVVRVVLSEGTGFLRGEVSTTRAASRSAARSPCCSATAAEPESAADHDADDRGRFTLAGRAGESVVRIQKPGFTTVERRVSIPVGSAATMVDARLTPVPTAGAAATGLRRPRS